MCHTTDAETILIRTFSCLYHFYQFYDFGCLFWWALTSFSQWPSSHSFPSFQRGMCTEGLWGLWSLNVSNAAKWISSTGFTAQEISHSTDCGQSTLYKDGDRAVISPGAHRWQGLDFLRIITGWLEVPSVVILCYVEFSGACPWAANLLFTTQSTAVPAAGG